MPLTSHKKWSTQTPDPDLISALAHEYHPTLATLLVNRNILTLDQSKDFLTPRLSNLHDPSLLPGMAEATHRILRAIDQNQTILVHGDYDVDGVTGTALLVRLFEHLGASVTWHVPNRFTDGYAFGDHSVEKAKATGAKLVISVDNGTSSSETITKLAAAGIDTIVTDHHEPPEGELPAAVAIVNPKLPASEYPFRELCGAAVAFKLAWGLAARISDGARVRDDLRDLLVDLTAYVAIATICDVVPMIGENRILAHFGLKALEATQSAGLRALLNSADLSGRRLGADDIGFQIGPRINASGRLGSAGTALEALMTTDATKAKELTQKLNSLNVQRRAIVQDLMVEALPAAQEFADAERWPVTVVAGQGWHQGVIGIVAARLVEEFGKPAIVIGLDGRSGRGSARSVPGFSILDAMRGASHLLGKHGGHEQAAGCDIDADKVEAVREAVCQRAGEMLAGKGLPQPELLIDAVIPFEHMTADLQRHLERLEPFGTCNPAPILASSDVRLAEPPRIVGKDRTHMLLRLRHGEHVLKAMAFGMAWREPELQTGTPLKVAYTPRWNTFRGSTSLELTLHDFEA
jgi:single-stranded-DNA-specific exonuclease